MSLSPSLVSCNVRDGLIGVSEKIGAQLFFGLTFNTYITIFRIMGMSSFWPYSFVLTCFAPVGVLAFVYWTLSPSNLNTLEFPPLAYSCAWESWCTSREAPYPVISRWHYYTFLCEFSLSFCKFQVSTRDTWEVWNVGQLLRYFSGFIWWISGSVFVIVLCFTVILLFSGFHSFRVGVPLSAEFGSVRLSPIETQLHYFEHADKFMCG